MAEIYLGEGMDIEIQKVQRIPPTVTPNRYTLTQMIIKLFKARNEKIMFIQQEKKWHSSCMRGDSVRLLADFSA